MFLPSLLEAHNLVFDWKYWNFSEILYDVQNKTGHNSKYFNEKKKQQIINFCK